MGKDTTFKIGCQSWGYEDWVTPVGAPTIFYPRGTKRNEMLSLYSRVFDTIEVDSTLYGTPQESTFQNWYNETPENFTFSLKFPREITHDHVLRGPSAKLMREFVERSELLREKLGVLLIQFPASFEPTADNVRALERFIKILPGHLRFAVEFRDAAWFVDQTFKMLEKEHLCLGLTDGKWVPRKIVLAAAQRVPSRHRYIRIMGERDLPRFDRVYRNQDDVLHLWASKLKELEADEIFIYIDNYFEGHAPATVNKLRSRLGLSQGDPVQLEEQGSLF